VTINSNHTAVDEEPLVAPRKSRNPRLPQSLRAFHHIYRADLPDSLREHTSPGLGQMLDPISSGHARLHRLAGKVLTPRRIAALKPRIQEIATALADAMPDCGRAELIQDFAQPLTLAVICEAVGVPSDERACTAARLSDYLSHLVAAKQARPEQDLLSSLARTHDDGDALNKPELASIAFLLLVAGYETAVDLIADGAYALLRATDLDLNTDNVAQLPCGHEIHHCLGSPLARLEADIAFTTLLRRFPHLHLADPDFTSDGEVGALAYSVTTLPVHLRARTRTED
jgi:cytochrome P450